MMMIKNLFKAYRKNEDGVAIIEGVMILPIAILLFIGIFETGQMLLLNQKIYAASHMTADLIARKGFLDNNDLEDAYAAGRMIVEPFDSDGLQMRIVGVRYTGTEAQSEQLWQRTFGGIANDPDLYTEADGLGITGEGAIVVSTNYTYRPTFLNLRLPFIDSENIFNVFDMEEISVLRGRVNACITYNDGGTIYRC